MERNKTEAQSSSSQCSVRGHNIKATKKTRGGLISGGAYNGMYFLLTGRCAYNRGGGLKSGSLRYLHIIYMENSKENMHADTGT